MRVVPLELVGALLIEPTIFRDERGGFLEGWNARTFAAHGIRATFVQENISLSSRFVLRGLHYQLGVPQGKLIRVTAGEIFDVIVDIRRSSSTYGKFACVTLNSKDFRSLWVPAGFAHGFLCVADGTQVQYKVTEFWAPDQERTLAWDDPALAVPWPLPTGTRPIVSEKDRRGQRLAEAQTDP
jgi:dTDP-4-dehydrorhamnose 3,5-epimerase